jgi:hypothetical protein
MCTGRVMYWHAFLQCGTTAITAEEVAKSLVQLARARPAGARTPVEERLSVPV